MANRSTMKLKSTLLSVFFLFFITALIGQEITLNFPERPQTVNVCGADSLSYFRIEIQDSTDLETVKIRLPDGLEYVPGSLSMIANAGFTLAEFDVSDLNNPVFAPDISAVGGGNFVEFTIAKTAACDAIAFVEAGNLAQDTISVLRDAMVGDTAISSSYDINYASISIAYERESARDTTVNDLPSMVCREIRIINGGTGYLTKVNHQVTPGSDLVDYALRFQGDTILPVSSSGGTLFYEFDLTQPPFANNFGDGDTLFENGESIIFEECFTVNSCDFSDGTVQHQSSWGCGGNICEESNVINGSVDLQFNQPNLNSSIDFRDNIVCMDGMDRGVIRMKVWNDGDGPAVLNRLSVRANGANTAIDTANITITQDGMDIKSYFPQDNPTVNPGLACGSNVTRIDFASSDFVSSFQLFPGDTVYAEMQYVLCCPTACGDYTSSNPSIELRGSDLCGQNNQSVTQSAGSGGSASVSDPIVSGTSVLSDGQVETYCAEYPNYTLLPVTPADSSYVSFVVELPDGLVFDNPGNTTVTYQGMTIPIASTTVVGDSLIVHMALSDVPSPGNAPLKVCFDVRAVCVDGMGGLASLTLGQSTSIHCDPLCMIRLNCVSRDVIIFGCGTGDCTEGGGNIFSYDVQRISFGYEDPEDDRDWTSFVRADSADVDIKRAMIGDTIRHRSKLGFTEGTYTSWEQAAYKETYTKNWQDVLCPDTAWVVIRNGSNTYTAGGLTPTPIQNGFEYDLSVSNLSALGDLPSGYTFSSSDTLYVNTQYGFCKSKAPDWLSIQPGVYEPVNDREDVIFTGGFEAVPSGETVAYGCGEAYDEMFFLGAALSVDIKSGGFSGSGCDRNFRYLFEIRQNIGGVLSGYTGTYDFFPNEFRPLYIPDSIVVKKQPDIIYDRARLVTRQINNAMPPAQEELDKDIPLTYETDSTLVFKVRDVHDAFGGMLFPYEEENADLRYYIEFRRSCASPQAMRTDLEIAYASPLCPGDEFQTVRNNLSTGNNSNLYNIDFTQTPRSKGANNNSTCFELEVRPRGGLLSYTWIEFPANADVTILSVSQNGTNIAPDAEGRYLLGSHAGNATKTFTICADLNTCNQTDFDVLFGWDCNGYPGDVAYEGTCSYDLVTYTMETVPSRLQLNLVTQPGIDPMTGNYPDLCEDLLYELTINSANAGSVIEPSMDITLPDGFVVDMVEAEYPNNSNNLESMGFTVNGNILSVDLYNHSQLVNDSLPGTFTDANPNNRQIFVRIHGRTDCDFRSGSRLFFTLFGDRPCGEPVLGSGTQIGTDRLYIEGLKPYDVNPDFTVDANGGVTCAFSTPINVSFQVEGGDFVGADSGLITLSPGVDYIPGSLVCSNDPSICPQIDRIVSDPNNPGGTLIYISYPSTILEGDIVNYTFEVIAEENSSCGQEINIELENYITVSGFNCAGTACPDDLIGITGAGSIELEIVHPELAFNGLTANTINGTPYLEYTGSLTVAQRDLSVEDSLYVIAYCADAMGMSTGFAVDSVLITGPVAIGSTIPFSGSFLQSLCDLDNGLVVTAEPVNGCLCTDPVLSQPNVGSEQRTFDLALAKTFTEPVGMKYGDTLTFDIQVFNQGDVPADSFEITDYIPSGLSYVADNDADGWNYDGTGKAKRWVTGPLVGGADTTISISLKLEYTFEVGAYINVAEISQDANPFDLDDIDSTPDDDPDNDAGGKPDSPADDYVDGDGTGTPGDGVAETDEDDHDPARVTIADLALRKVMSDDTPGPYRYGDTLRMNIELYNQGNVPTNYIEVTDYLPAGLTYIDDATLNAGWDGTDPSNPVYTWTNDTLFQAESDTISIYVVLNMVDMPDSSSWTNFSEISVSRDTLGMDLDDIDSQADNDPTNDAGGQPESPADDHIGGDGTGTPGDGVAETDEDDHDPLHVDVFDLALAKTFDQPIGMVYGDTLVFDIQIFNQGNVVADRFEITDYIPSGLTYVTDNDADGWVYDGVGKAKRWVEGPLESGADTTISISLILEYTYEVGAYINISEISQHENPKDLDDIDSTPDDDPDNDAGGQPDSPADDYVDGDGTGTPGDGVAETDEDDHDPARVTIADLALRKVMSDDTPGPYRYGDTLRMNIELYNQGNVPTNYIEVTDYLPAGLTYIDDATLNAGWDGTDPSNPVYTWTNDTLFQTESDTISIYVVLNMVDMPDSSSWTNFSEISVSRDTLGMDLDDIDSQADNDQTNDAGGQPESPADDHIGGDGTGTPGDGVAETDEDDHDPLHVDVFDLALAKTFDQPIGMVYGDTLVFDIQIFNQGNVVADRFEITDYIPSGLTYVTDNDADGWVYDGVGKAKRWVEGPLESGADTTISISLILEYTYEVGAYINITEISQHENPKDLDDIDSTPDDDPDNDAGGQPDSPADDYVDGDGTGTPGDGVAETDEDDHDPARVTIADLALRKVMSDDTPGPYKYGDTLRMNIELYNQGNVPTNYIEVTDYLPAGLTYIDDATLNAGWDGTDPSNPVYTWTNDTLFQTESDTISIYVVLDMVDMPDSSSWTNFSEISVSRDTLGMDLDDIDSQADNDPTNDAGGQPESPADDHIDGDGTGTPGDGVAETDEDDHDPLRVAIYDLALTKMINPSNPGPYRYGDTILLDITVYNQGNEPGNAIEVTDYMPDGMTYVPGVITGWDDTDPENPFYFIPDTLYAGLDTTFQIPVRLGQGANAASWDNYAEISAASNKDGDPLDDIDSDADNDPDNDYGAVPDGDTDDETGGDAKQDGTPDGDDDPSFDEDDHDVARVRIVDFALIKQIDSLNSEYPLQFGSLIKFDIIVQNQGNVVSDSIRVVDYVPAGFGFDPNLSENIAEGWQADGTAMIESRLDFGEFDTISIYKTLQPVSDPMMDSWTNYAEILEAYDTTGMEIAGEDFDSEPGSDSPEERDVRPGDPGDDDFDSTGRDDEGSEDDHDPAGVMFLDLALYKTVDSTETNFPVRYGDLIKFDIHVINQEGVMVDSVRVGDYIPEGYAFDPSIPENQAFGWQSDATTVIEGPVNVGDTVTASIYLELNQISVPTDRSWVNYAEILEAWNNGMEIAGMDIDSEPGSDSPEEREVYPGQPGDDDVESISRDSLGSEDDHDPAFVEVFDLALRKTTEEEIGYPTLEAQFDITIFNQGGIPATNIEVTDYIPIGYDFDANLNPDWAGSAPLVTYLITDTLYPGENTTISIILTVNANLDPDNLINVSEISAAQDTSGMDREDIDGVFDQNPDNDAGGEPDSPADDYVDGDGTGNIGDGVAETDEDNSDPAKIIPCLAVNCHAYINLGFGEDCEILVTPDMLLVDNRLAVVRPDFYKVELFYGPDILIPDNILRPEHAGREITARITFLIDECGNGTCEATIVLDKPNACLIKNTLDTTVYCIDPFLALDPMDPAYPKPELVNVCNSAELKLELSPDWIMPVSCDEANDTAEVIFREWTATTKDGERCVGVDTIVVMRLPKLTPEAFIGTAEDTVYCELEPVPNDGGLLKRYASWKQPVGLHDYELPYAKLRGVTYELPLTVVEAGLDHASDEGLLDEYLNCVILRQSDGSEVTIGDLVTGSYMDNLLEGMSSAQRGYGFLQAILDGNETPETVSTGMGSFTFYPYLLLQSGDQVLSEDGGFEQVDADWFYSGHGNSPYWFSGGWPSIYGNGDCVSYCDTGSEAPGDLRGGCILIQVPSLSSEGFSTSECDTICLTAGGIHCGITIERDVTAGWQGDCPQTRGVDTKITQTCWAETPNFCAGDGTADELDLVASYDSTSKRIEIALSQWQTLIDTLGPIFEFCYPEGWDQTGVQASIRNGEQYGEALSWERSNPTIYRVGESNCEAEVYVPAVELVDNCSGIHSVKAMMDVRGGTRAVELEHTSTRTKVLANGDTCTIYTYSHTSDPIRVPFTECEGALNEVRYEAADNCWNQSRWTKFIEITDDVPPTVVVNRNLNVTLTNKIAWARATSFDEGSWDNCAIGLRLGRRTDWLSESGMVDLCDGNRPHAPYDNWVDLLDDLGVDRTQAATAVTGGEVSMAAFNAKYNVNDLSTILNDGEVERYYYKQIEWLWEDEEACGEKVVHGWLYSMAAHIAEHCSSEDEHGNALRVSDLEAIFDRLTGTPGYGQEMAYLGGGWTKEVPFKCGDACEEVPVELLVMDHCCNFGIGRTGVQVDDESAAKLVKRLPDLAVSCEAYDGFYKDIVAEAAALGEQGSAVDENDVFAALDSVFGRYIPTWVDGQNRPTDIDGNLLPNSALYFDYHSISCGEKSETEQVAVEGHDGQIDWVNQVTQTTYLDTTDYTGSNGVIQINCAAELVQDVWVDLDECGQGTLTRRFFITSGCGSGTPELVLEQVIRIESACGLRASMFDLPANVGSQDDPICLPESLTKDYLPDTIGAAVVKSHLDDALCASIAIGKTVKELNVLGSDMKKYEITWSMIDWCADHTSSARELTHVQTVIARIDPSCAIDGGTGSGDVSLITGQILTELNSPVKGIDVKAVLGSGSPLEVSTSEDGRFSMTVDQGSTVSIVPYKNSDFAAGVSTADLIDMQRHILQKKRLDSKYQRIAADVNGNGLIDGLDVLELRKVVLNPSRVFANNTSWRFYDTATGQEVFDLEDVSEDHHVEFTGVKIGDVNLSVFRQNVGSDPTSPDSYRGRSTKGQLHLNMADKVLKGGEVYRIEVRSDNFENIRGLQYTLDYADAYVSVESMESGVLNITGDNYLKYSPGVVTASWNAAEGVSAAADEVLFTIVVKAKSAAQLRDVLSVSNRVTATEAYTSAGDYKDIGLHFNGTDAGFALYQNTPNPFNGETVIGFKLPEATSAVMTIYDVNGRLIKRMAGDYEAGYHEVRVTSMELGVTGVLYYQLDTDKYTATKKMIVVE